MFIIGKANFTVKRSAVSNLRFVKAESSSIHYLKTNTQLKYWGNAVVSSFMYFRIHVLEPACKVYVFGCTKRLKQHSTTYSAMQKSVVASAKKCLPSSRGEERKGSAPQYARLRTLRTVKTLNFRTFRPILGALFHCLLIVS